MPPCCNIFSWYMESLFTKYVTDGRGGGIGCLKVHFGEWLHSVLELVVSLETVLGRKPLDVVGGGAVKADDGALELNEDDEESGLEMEDRIGSLLVSIMLWLKSSSW